MKRIETLQKIGGFFYSGVMRLIWITLLLVITACEKKQQLSYAGYECWQLSGNDLLQDVNLHLESYEPYGTVGDLTIPLSKVVRADSFLIYIGISVDHSIEEVTAALKKSSEYSETDPQDNTVHYYWGTMTGQPLGRMVFQQKELGYPVVISFLNRVASLVPERKLYQEYVASHKCR